MTTQPLRRNRPERDTTEMADMLRRVARSMARRAEAGDIEALEFLVQLQRDLDTYIDQAARGLHAEPGRYTWGEIGRWLGITRQAARQRFGQ